MTRYCTYCTEYAFSTGKHLNPTIETRDNDVLSFINLPYLKIFINLELEKQCVKKFYKKTKNKYYKHTTTTTKTKTPNVTTTNVV